MTGAEEVPTDMSVGLKRCDLPARACRRGSTRPRSAVSLSTAGRAGPVTGQGARRTEARGKVLHSDGALDTPALPSIGLAWHPRMGSLQSLV